MISRTPLGYAVALRDQYEVLKLAVDGYYAGVPARAMDIAVRIRTLVHETGNCKPLLAAINRNYLELDIYHKVSDRRSGALFSMSLRMKATGPDSENKSGAFRFDKDVFEEGFHQLVPLHKWWSDPYLIILGHASSKRDIVLDVADKDGGAHVDPKVSERHAINSCPPVEIISGGSEPVRPDLARAVVAEAGHELVNYLERHFASQLAATP